MTERVIETNTPPLQRYQVGDHVAHVNLGDGEVIRNSGNEIEVRYAPGVVGIYDRVWFEKNHRLLFHRGTTDQAV